MYTLPVGVDVTGTLVGVMPANISSIRQKFLRKYRKRGHRGFYFPKGLAVALPNSPNAERREESEGWRACNDGKNRSYCGDCLPFAGGLSGLVIAHFLHNL